MSAAGPSPQNRISVRVVADPSTPFGRKLWTWGPLVDRIIGIDRIQALAERCEVFGLEPRRFASQALSGMRVRLRGGEALEQRLPRSGPVVVVANHPHGGIEGLILLRLLLAVRPDVKIMANTALRVFADLQPAMLFVNPLMPKHPENIKGLRESLRHLKEGGVLVIFPASRTSFFRTDLRRITDGEWNRVVANLARRTGASLLPVRFCDLNSKWFYRIGRVWARFRLLMLARELLNKEDKEIRLAVGTLIPSERLEHLDDATYTETARLFTYLLLPPGRDYAPTPSNVPVKKVQVPIATAQSRDRIEAEIEALPIDQFAHRGNDCLVFFGKRAHFPTLVEEITRERERTFRMLDEGSGEAVDTDAFDDISEHIVVWDMSARALVGAYRLGRRDQLIAGGGTYLDQMFEFDDAFFVERPAALELGRSFVTLEYQRARHALDFLWRGIGGFLRANPTYGTLYGTVSLTTQYDPISIALMCDVLIDAPEHIRPRRALDPLLPPDWAEYRSQCSVDRVALDKLIAAREGDGKGIPILVKHYASLGARFHAVGVDPNFAGTPGLLLSVDTASIPARKRRRYLA